MTVAGGHEPDLRPLAVAHRRLVAAVRDGSLERDVDLDELELAHRMDATPDAVRDALDRMAYFGLIRRTGPTTVRLTQLSPTRWAEGTWALLDLLETGMRATIAELRPEQAERYAILAAEAQRADALRTDVRSTTMLATLTFWAEETPNRFVGRVMRRVLDQYRYGLVPSPQWRIEGLDRWLAASLQAVRSQDAVRAQQAVHVLARLWPDHLADVARSHGTTNADPVRTPGSSEDPAFVEAEPDALWFDVLGAIRDGSMPPGPAGSVRALARRFRASATRLLPIMRRLDLMRLVDLVPGADDQVVVRVPDLRDWVDSIQAATGMFEGAFRRTLPDLSEAEADEVLVVLQRIGRLGLARDFGYPLAIIALARFFVDRTPNVILRDVGRLAMDRLAYIWDDRTPFRQWALDDVLELASDAVRSRDTELVTEAMHAYALHIDAHIAEVRARYGSMD